MDMLAGGDLATWVAMQQLQGALRASLTDEGDDPLRVLMDPDRTEPYEYEWSKTDLVIPASWHPKQLEALHAPERFRWLFWANQSGKTTFGAQDTALMALGRHPLQRWEPPLLIWASALTWDLWEQILLPELLTWLPRDRVISAPPPKQRSTLRVIKVRADNGRTSLIVGKSAEQGAAKYQSARVHHIWMDEEHPESVYDEIQPRLLRYGGTTLTTATPLLGLTWMYHRIYDPWKRGQVKDHYCSHAGLADNPSISPEMVEAITREFEADPAQAEARLYGRFATPTGIAIKFDPGRHYEEWNQEKAEKAREQQWIHLGGMDFGYWRFGFVHGVVDRDGRCHVISELFSQKEDLGVRAKRVHGILDAAGAPPSTRIYGDAANPTDIVEINREFSKMGSPYRVRPVRAEHKARQASVTLVNNLLLRGALVFRKGMNERTMWRLGQSAATEGRPQMGSRLMFEIGLWRYPPPRDGQAQVQDPDDNTADGADLVAALRYMVMSHFRPAKPEQVVKEYPKNFDHGLEKHLAKEQGTGFGEHKDW